MEEILLRRIIVTLREREMEEEMTEYSAENARKNIA